MNDIALFLKVLEFSAERHRKQLRKGSETIPYINHPIHVASILANEGGEDDIVLLSAAFLHDAIEDTVDSLQEKEELITRIGELFGDEILSLVLEVTDDKSLEKSVRKQLQIEHAPLLSDRAKKLKIADKISNIHDIARNPPVGWTLERKLEYLDWAEKVVKAISGVNQPLEDLFFKYLAEAREQML